MFNFKQVLKIMTFFPATINSRYRGQGINYVFGLKISKNNYKIIINFYAMELFSRGSGNLRILALCELKKKNP